jgi:hypothetical protein
LCEQRPAVRYPAACGKKQRSEDGAGSSRLHPATRGRRTTCLSLVHERPCTSRVTASNFNPLPMTSPSQCAVSGVPHSSSRRSRWSSLLSPPRPGRSRGGTHDERCAAPEVWLRGGTRPVLDISSTATPSTRSLHNATGARVEGRVLGMDSPYRFRSLAIACLGQT